MTFPRRLPSLLLLLSVAALGCDSDVTGAPDLATGGGADLTTTSDLSGGDLASSAGDLSAGDLSVGDLASPAGDLAVRPPLDLAVADLAGYSGIGEPCGGFVMNPKQCKPGLVCVGAPIPDAPGTCASPDAGACHPNGASCGANGDCCSGNCILRANPGFCCEPGGCP